MEANRPTVPTPRDLAARRRILGLNAAWSSFNQVIKPHVRSYERRLRCIQRIYNPLDKALDWLYGKALTLNSRVYDHDIEPARAVLESSLAEVREKYERTIGALAR